MSVVLCRLKAPEPEPRDRSPAQSLEPSANLLLTRAGFVVKYCVMNTTALIGRPQPGEYAPYYDRYISLVPGDNILDVLDEERRKFVLLLSGRSEADGNFRYAPDKWTVKELLGHINDGERIFAYRALRIARGDQTPIEGFEQDDYVRNASFNRCSLEDLVEDYISVRRATLSLFRNLDPEAWTRRGIANNNEVSVRAIAYTIAGHNLHHRSILEERYFEATAA
jgi:hypothetical protein